jgi:predicted dehydrogenase
MPPTTLTPFPGTPAFRTLCGPGESPRAGASTPKPDKPTDPPSGSWSSRRPVGKPVSQTAAAQEGKPKIPAPPGTPSRFALVGLGKLTVEEILPALRLSTTCQVSALVTGNPDKGRAVADFLGLPHDRVYDYADISRFADDPAIDAVYIATPNALHARDAVPALKAGKHVLCEKPISTTLADADAMIDAAESAGRKLMVAYRVHHEPINLAIRDMVSRARYGKPLLVTFDACTDVGDAPQHRLDPDLGGGGSLFDIGIYALNTTRWLLGEDPAEVSAMRQDLPGDKRFRTVEPSIAFQLRFPSGAIANCTSSFATPRVNRYRIICEDGWMGMDPATHYRGLRGEHGDDDQHVLLKDPQSVNQFTAEFEHFARCIQDDTPVESPGEEGRRDVDLILKIYEAARTGRTVTVTD